MKKRKPSALLFAFSLIFSLFLTTFASAKEGIAAEAQRAEEKVAEAVVAATETNAENTTVTFTVIYKAASHISDLTDEQLSALVLSALESATEQATEQATTTAENAKTEADTRTLVESVRWSGKLCYSGISPEELVTSAEVGAWLVMDGRFGSYEGYQFLGSLEHSAITAGLEDATLQIRQVTVELRDYLAALRASNPGAELDSFIGPVATTATAKVSLSQVASTIATDLLALASGGTAISLMLVFRTPEGWNPNGAYEGTVTYN